MAASRDSAVETHEDGPTLDFADGQPTLEVARPAGPPAASQSGERRFRIRAGITDAVMMALAAALIAFISPTDSPTGHVPAEPFVWTLVFPALVFVYFRLRGMYKPPVRPDLLETIRCVATGAALAAVVGMTLRVLLENDAYVAAETVRHWLLAVFLLSVGRGAVLWLETRARVNGGSLQPTLIIGSGRIGELVTKRLLREPEFGLRPIGFLDDNPIGGAGSLPVLGTLDDLEGVVAEHGIERALITFSRTRDEDLLALARRCWEAGLTVSIVPRLFEIQGERTVVKHIGGVPIVTLSLADPDGWQFSAKYACDRLFAALALVLLAPVMLIAAAALRLVEGGPVLYRQRRVGLDGREFDMLKFRTMRPGAGGSEADADWAAEEQGLEARPVAADDGRITRIGALLRRYSLDELPQLINVMSGDMSLIGPRPERASYVEQFSASMYRYTDRHRVKSGLTGWAQVNGLRGKTSLADRIELDNYYIENWSLWLDFKILLRTVPCLVRGEGRS